MNEKLIKFEVNGAEFWYTEDVGIRLQALLVVKTGAPRLLVDKFRMGPRATTPRIKGKGGKTEN